MSYNLLFLILFVFQQNIKSEILKFPFKTEIEEITNNDIYTSTQIKNKEIINLEIGNPIQKIPVVVKFNEFSFYISGNLVLNSIYNEKNSNSFSSNNKTEFSCSDNTFNLGFYAKENFYFSNIKNDNLKYEKIQFILATSITKDDNNVLGLKIIKNKEKEKDNFINELKSKKIINNNIWTFKFDKKDFNKGDFIIGDYPHNYDLKNFKKENLKITKIENSISHKFNEWIIKFDDIKFNDTNIIIRNVKLEIEFGLIKAPANYYNIFYNKIFINCYYSQHNCEQIDLNYNYFSYVFNKNFDISKFPNITFFNKELEYNFTLDYKDLFKEFNGKYYFLIVFQRNYNMDWTFGKLFFKKYQFIFNTDNRIIGFYNQNVQIKKSNFYVYFIFIFCLIFIILILFYIYFSKFRSRKIRLNEIEDGYDYTPNNNIKENQLYFSI